MKAVKENKMKVLVAEESFSNPKVLEKVLSKVGHCHVVPDGEQAMFAFRRAWASGNPFSLVCLNLTTGETALKAAISEIRNIEREFGATELTSTKVIFSSPKSTKLQLDKSQKGIATVEVPLDLSKLEVQLKEFGLI